MKGEWEVVGGIGEVKDGGGKGEESKKQDCSVSVWKLERGEALLLAPPTRLVSCLRGKRSVVIYLRCVVCATPKNTIVEC